MMINSLNEILLSQQIYGPKQTVLSSFAATHLEIKQKLSAHSGCVNTIAFNSDASLLVSGSDDTRLHIRNESYALSRNLETLHTHNIFSAKFISDSLLVSCDARGLVSTTQIDSSTCQPFNCHLDMTFQVLAKDGSFFSCANDGRIKFFDLRTTDSCNCHGCEKYTAYKTKSGIASIDFCGDFGLLAANQEGYVEWLDTRSLKTPVESYKPENFGKKRVKATCVKAGSDRHFLVSYAGDGVYVFENGVQVAACHGHRNEDTMIKEAGFWNSHVATGSDDGSIFIYDLTGRLVAIVQHADSQVVNCILPHPYKVNTLLTSGIDNDIKVWGVGTAQNDGMDELEAILQRNESDRMDERVYLTPAMLWMLLTQGDDESE